MLIEKPVAASLDQARRMVAAVERSNVAALVGHHRLYSAVMAAAGEVIGAGELGQLVAVQGSALFHKPASYYTEAPWRHRAGGGLILLNLVGEIDNLRLLGGEIEAVQALASNARAVATRSKTRWQSRCTSPTARSGLPAVRRGREHRSWEQTSGANPACARDPAEACCLVSGDRGTLALPSLRRQTVTGEPSWTTPMSERTLAVVATDPLQRQLSTSPR